MKFKIKDLYAILMAGGIMFLLPLSASAQRFSIKPNVNIGVGSTMSIKSDFKDLTKSSNSTDFGVDLGYKFWELGGNRLEVNLGLGYSTSNIKLKTPEIKYNYNAPSYADEDGNTYIRYYELSEISQKVNLGYFTVPLYLTYGYQFSQRVGIHADLGFKFGFKCNAKLNEVTGTSYSYGVYPEYDDLVISDSWLNGFGESNLEDAMKGKVQANGFYSSLLAGVVFDVNVHGPLWLNVGLRYNCGFTNSFKHFYSSNDFTAVSAPVTYSVENSEEVKPFTSYLTSSKLSPLTINLGFTINL